MGEELRRGGAMTKRFDYDTAFSRNIGWVTKSEQRALRAGGSPLRGSGASEGFTCSRWPAWVSEDSNVAELDHFDLVNFNRQAE